MNAQLRELWEKARDVNISVKRVGPQHTETLVTVTVIVPIFRFVGPALNEGVEELAPLVLTGSGHVDRPDYEAALTKAVEALMAQAALHKGLG